MFILEYTNADLFVSCSLIYTIMRTNEILKELQRLPLQKRIYVIEKTINSIRKQEESSQMKKAAKALYSDYKNDPILTEFTNIDFEDFYETR